MRWRTRTETLTGTRRKGHKKQQQHESGDNDGVHLSSHTFHPFFMCVLADHACFLFFIMLFSYSGSPYVVRASSHSDSQVLQGAGASTASADRCHTHRYDRNWCPLFVWTRGCWGGCGVSCMVNKDKQEGRFIMQGKQWEFPEGSFP